MHTYIHAFVHACIHTCIHACIHTCIHACIHTYIHTCIHTYMHLCMHAYIYTYIHISAVGWSLIYSTLCLCLYLYAYMCTHIYAPCIYPQHYRWGASCSTFTLCLCLYLYAHTYTHIYPPYIFHIMSVPLSVCTHIYSYIRTIHVLATQQVGCIMFYILSSGQHPFGEWIERDSNIVRDRPGKHCSSSKLAVVNTNVVVINKSVGALVDKEYCNLIRKRTLARGWNAILTLCAIAQANTVVAVVNTNVVVINKSVVFTHTNTHTHTHTHTHTRTHAHTQTPLVSPGGRKRDIL